MPQRVFAFCSTWKRETVYVRPFAHLKQWCGDRWYRIDGYPRLESRPDRSPVARDRYRQLKLRAVGFSQVYFLQEGGTGAIKIGVAMDVRARVRGLTSGTPHQLVVLVAIDGDRSVERTTHRRFRQACIRGEWFRPIPELLAYIQTLLQSDEGNAS